MVVELAIDIDKLYFFVVFVDYFRLDIRVDVPNELVYTVSVGL